METPFTKDQETQREKNRYAAVALLAVLLLWVIIGSGQREKILSPEIHECLGLVSVVGDVVSPGTFLLKGSGENNECILPMKHIVRAAGGLKRIKAGAMASHRDMPVRLGQKVVVTRLDWESVSFRLEPLDGQKRFVWGEKLDVNRASPEALGLIPRMRDEFVQDIVEGRKQRPWKKLRDLTRIRGVGPKTVELWSEYLEVETVE